MYNDIPVEDRGCHNCIFSDYDPDLPMCMLDDDMLGYDRGGVCTSWKFRADNPNPTKDQMKAIKSLERAFEECRKAGVRFHNCYEHLMAYNGNVVSYVDDKKEHPDEVRCYAEGYEVENTYQIDMWADDKHYIHIKEELRG